jgi:serine/threonine protein phosphatase PrpC
MDTPRQTLHDLDVPLLCLVADGMGGHAAGEEASRLAAFRLAESVPSLDGEPAVAAFLRQVNREIFDAMRENSQCRGMGTTVAGLMVRPGGVLWFNVGDSRVFRYRDRFLRQLSIDDVPDLDVGRTGRSGSLTQALGGAATFIEVVPHVGTDPLVPGWRYLLCSDGLTDMVDLAAIEAAMAAADAAAVTRLFERAMIPGQDNISIIVATIEQAAGSSNERTGESDGVQDAD